MTPSQLFKVFRAANIMDCIGKPLLVVKMAFLWISKICCHEA